MTGQRFDRLVVLRKADKDSWTDPRRAEWICRCDCGTELKANGKNLRRSNTRSCGCLQREKAGQHLKRTMAKLSPAERSQRSRKAAALTPPQFTHGATRGGRPSRTYVSWLKMRERCFNPSHNRYVIYGARGITVCDRWRDSFENFLADMGERPEGKTIDRIDPDGNYEPRNCRWATPKEQQANKR